MKTVHLPNMAIHIAGFSPRPVPHGGTRRSDQLVELFKESTIKSIYLPERGELLRFSLSCPLSTLASCGWFIRYLSLGLSFRGAIAAIILEAWLSRNTSLKQAGKISIELTSSFGILAALLLVQKGYRLHVYPHNIEFLVPFQRMSFFRSRQAAFDAEVSIMKCALSINTISLFDASILRCLGVQNVSCLPYRPPSDVASGLLDVRLRRQESPKEAFLIFGSVTNRPTQLGVEALLTALSSCTVSSSFILAGNGTEAYAGSSPSCVNVLGTVDNMTADMLLVTCQALVLFQPQTSGIVTRVIEAQLAGIPVILIGDYAQSSEYDQTLLDCFPTPQAFLESISCGGTSLKPVGL